jgi:hypothetical protein
MNLNFKLACFIEVFCKLICVLWKFMLLVFVQILCSNLPSFCSIGYSPAKELAT